MPVNISTKIESTETILAQTVTLLEAAGFTTVKFSGATLTQMKHVLSTAKMPAAVVIYGGSRYDNRGMPKRIAELAIVARTQNKVSREDSGVTSRAALDSIIAAIDAHQYNDLTWDVQSDAVFESDDHSINYVVRFDVYDI